MQFNKGTAQSNSSDSKVISIAPLLLAFVDFGDCLVRFVV